MKFIIEHLEPEMFPWCEIEYKNISKIVGKDNLLITNVKKKDIKKLHDFADVSEKTIAEMDELDTARTCVLDPAGTSVLSPTDASQFDVIILGGILGDYPPKERTKEEITLTKAIRRHLGKDQLPTDNAAYVAHKIISGTPFKDLKFQHELELDLDDGESVILPFTYVLIDGKPMISEPVKEILRKEYSFD